ncbi:hypothetical protein B7463_g3345, partial [Scytalidium lignicola]
MMSVNLVSSAAAGTLFGAALAASGVYSPAVIISQMQLRDFHMLEVFLSASATSALIIIAFDRLGLSNTTPRAASSFGWFSKYDGNIVGGLLIGTGMSLSGACPGTSLVQAVTGVRSGMLVMVGGVLGGLFYLKVSKYLRKKSPHVDTKAIRTIYEKFHISKGSAVMIYEIACLVVISAVISLRQHRPVLFHSAVGGLLIGGAQAASLLLTGNLVGVSIAYEDLARCVREGATYVRGGKSSDDKALSIKSITFAMGILAGSYTVASYAPSLMVKSDIQISAIRAVAGGFVMVFGARIAGGCTSGHGISGMSMLSLSSIISVASMFAGGIGLAAFTRSLCVIGAFSTILSPRAHFTASPVSDRGPESRDLDFGLGLGLELGLDLGLGGILDLCEPPLVVDVIAYLIVSLGITKTATKTSTYPRTTETTFVSTHICLPGIYHYYYKYSLSYSTTTTTTTTTTTSIISSCPSSAPTLSCDKYGYLIRDATLYRVDLSTGSNMAVKKSIGDGSSSNVLAHNSLDNYIYAYQTGNRSLLRVFSDDSSEQITEAAAPPHVNLGDIDLNGRYWIANNGWNWWQYDLYPGSPYLRTSHAKSHRHLAQNHTSGGSTLIGFNLTTLRWENVANYPKVRANPWGAQYGMNNGTIYASDNDGGEI